MAYTEADLDEMQSLLDCTYEDYQENPWFIRNDKKEGYEKETTSKPDEVSSRSTGIRKAPR